jgi:hypothetical protein
MELSIGDDDRMGQWILAARAKLKRRVPRSPYKRDDPRRENRLLPRHPILRPGHARVPWQLRTRPLACEHLPNAARSTRNIAGFEWMAAIIHNARVSMPKSISFSFPAIIAFLVEDHQGQMDFRMRSPRPCTVMASSTLAPHTVNGHRPSPGLEFDASNPIRPALLGSWWVNWHFELESSTPETPYQELNGHSFITGLAVPTALDGLW